MVATVLDSVISLFLIMLVGVYASRRAIITQEINKGLINILIKIVLPFMVVSSFTSTFDASIKSNLAKGFFYSLVTYLILIITSYILLTPIKGDKKTIVHFANVFTNTGYIGFPVLNVIYGAEGVVYGSIFNMFFVIFVWTYGLMLFKGKIDKGDLRKEIIKTLLNPSIIAVLIGIIIVTFEIDLPKIINTSINSLGSISGPLSMIIIGVIVSKSRVGKSLRDWRLYYSLTIKIVVLPLILILISLLIEKSIVSNSVIIIASMPAAAMTSIFAESYNKEEDFASIIVLLTTLLSVISIPILVRILV